MNEKLPKAEKLKHEKLIKQLFDKGKRVKAFPLGLIYLDAELHGHTAIQVGFSVPKRIHKLAVTRNRLKRLMREVYRKNKHDFIIEDRSYAMMLIYTGKSTFSYTEMEESFKKLNTRFHKELKKGI